MSGNGHIPHVRIEAVMSRLNGNTEDKLRIENLILSLRQRNRGLLSQRSNLRTENQRLKSIIRLTSHRRWATILKEGRA